MTLNASNTEPTLANHIMALSESHIDDIVSLEELSMRTSTTFPLTRDDLEEAFKQGYKAFGYFDENDLLIAKVGFMRMPDGKLELDACVHPDCQGKGIGKKAIEASLEQIFLEDDSLEVFLTVHPENPALKLYERLNFNGHRDSNGQYERKETVHGPRIIMDYIRNRALST